MASNWAAVSDVQARLTNETISSSSNPTTTQVQTWLDEAEAYLRAALVAAELPSSFTAGTDAIEVLTIWVTDYAEGRARQAWASARGDGEQDGLHLVEEFKRRIEDIRASPAYYGQLLQGGDSNNSAVFIRSHVTHHPDGLSIGDGDFAPKFTRADGADQF